jgi:DNA repair photolyase
MVAMWVKKGGQAGGRADGTRIPAKRVPAVQQQLAMLLPPARPPARLTVIDERLRGTKFVTLEPRSILNSPAQTGMDFWSVNPYIGCEFGCTYCYARYAHRYVVERAHDAGKLTDSEFENFRGPHGWEAFENRIFVKEHLLGALESDLRRYFQTACPPARPTAEPIVIGTATDPYQPAERRFSLTRTILQRLTRCEGLSVGIITKSPLVTRDLDVLRRLQERNDLEVYISLIALDAPLIRKVEARSPVPAARLRALQKLTDAGVNAGLIMAPVLPGITDDVPHLEALFQAARVAGARFIHAGPLRLYAAVRDRFLPILDQHFPALGERYRRAYARQSSAPRAYARALNRRVKRLQARFGFPVNEGMVDRYKHRLPALQGSLELR